LVCEGENALVCAGDAATNACGGCGALTAQPDTPCGRCNSGRWRCDGDAAVVCEGDLGPGAENVCGGCVALPDTFGDACGTCNAGQIDCGGANLLVCDDPGDAALNACGGCGELPGVPGEACDACGGEWVCTDAGGLRCRAGTPNACGGCLPLPATPGDFCASVSCGFSGGEVACVDEDTVACFCEPPPETCGDGVLDLAEDETCDDGNRLSNDGCSNTCELETALRPTNGCAAPAVLPRNAILDFNLCFADDSTDNITTDACTSDRTDVDVVFRFDLPTRSRVFVEVADDDSVAVDPIVYIRTDCADEDTQLACGDDVPCDSADVLGACIGGLQPRVARIDTVLDAGRYALWVDSFEVRSGGTDFGCGNVELRIESTPVD
jgi:cysteine-rich repeat protein